VEADETAGAGSGSGPEDRSAPAVPAAQTGTRHPSGHLAEHPLPTGIVGALGLGGYQLLADVGGVGAGRLGPHAFLLLAPDPDPRLPDLGTQISLHHAHMREESEAAAFRQLAAHLGYLRLSGYRLVPERAGLRSKVAVVDPGTGAILVTIPERHPGRLFGGGASAQRLLATLRGLPPPGLPPDPGDPELVRDVLVALALADQELTGAQAAETADRALELMREGRAQDPVSALAAAKSGV
jgi:hypothetical protein